jgi:hypothetical protein
MPGWNQLSLDLQRIDESDVLSPIDEIPWMTTNDAAQWGLAAIQNLALIGDSIPAQTTPPE